MEQKFSMRNQQPFHKYCETQPFLKKEDCDSCNVWKILDWKFSNIKGCWFTDVSFENDWIASRKGPQDTDLQKTV